jgi:hypothetical protein
MCQNCSLNTNREAWAKYPDMLDLCKMCESFQAAIDKTIDEQAGKLGIVSDSIKKIRSK